MKVTFSDGATKKQQFFIWVQEWHFTSLYEIIQLNLTSKEASSATTKINKIDGGFP